MIKYYLSIFVILTFVGCHYAPFFQYNLPTKKDFPKFTEWQEFVGSNANSLRQYDVKRYVIDLDVSPEKKYIYGRVTIGLHTTGQQDTLMFDLHRALKLNHVSIGGKPIKFSREKDVVYIINDAGFAPKRWLEIDFDYEGKPKSVLGQGPIQWKKDKKERHHISTSTEGIGPHFFFPCNQLLGDEADKCFINITVPEGLTVSANGKLVKKEVYGKKVKFYHVVTNPINIYNISFNIGHFERLTIPYEDIHGTKRDIAIDVLDYNLQRADTFYQQIVPIMKELEYLYGPYPWWNDGLKIVESTFAAMEHQSAIAMGSIFYNDWKKEVNTTLIHELAHEWWGNKITGKDYCDMWIHEGMATYSELLVIEKLYGLNDYQTMTIGKAKWVQNKRPIHKKCGVLYNSWANPKDGDIYDKGAMLMHTLRTVMQNDALFFDVLKKMQFGWKVNNVSTSDFIQKFNQLSGADYTMVFISYLEEKEPPTLLVEQVDSNTVKYAWKRQPLFETGALVCQEGESVHKIFPEITPKQMTITPGNKLIMKYGECIYFAVEKTKFKIEK